MNSNTLSGFSSEMEKIADVIIGPKDDKEAPIVAGGIFVGTDTGHRKKSVLLGKLLNKHKSIQKTRQAYAKLHPDDFVTAAFKRESSPGTWTKVKSFFGADAAESAVKSYESRVKSPRTFLRVGPIGGYHQSAFYKEVARGLHDGELHQPHVPKKDRVVYT